jgi:GNAT superfamily N-acetyltransferase
VVNNSSAVETFVILSQTLTFRRIDPERDALLCASNHRDACIASFGTDRNYHGGDTYVAWLKNRVEEFPDGHVLAYIGSDCVGQLELQVPYGLTTGYANLYYVTTRFRGRGFGRLLHEYAERYFRSWEANRIELHVSPTNLRALAFYRRMNFRMVKVEGKAQRVWRMEKTLD